MASRVTDPQAAARSTLGSGRHTTTKASVRAAPHSAVARSESPSRGASPRRSARWALPGGPISRNSTTVRFDPETASRCSRSVARKASWRSAGTLEVSPTTSPGSRALASGASPSVASRRPARSRPATRWAAFGPPVTRGGASLAGRSTATARSPFLPGPARATTTSRVEGCSRAHSACAARTRTGVRTRVLRPSGPVTRPTTASSTTTGGPLPLREVRGSEATVSSASTRACCRASPATGPARASAWSSPATAAPAAAQSRAAATAGAVPHRGPVRRPATSRSRPAPVTARATPAAARPAGASSARAAAAQAATAGTAIRRSGGAPGSSGRFTAAPARAARRSGARRSRRPAGAPPPSGSPRGPCGSRRCAGPGRAPPPAGRRAARPWRTPG